jgi:hypothetical protein
MSERDKCPTMQDVTDEALRSLACARVVAAYWQAECGRRTTRADESVCWPTPIGVKDLAVVLRKAGLVP